ncbi:PREDICTED: U3 small nucleolar RNA-associated protein 14 homolog A-like [Papilio xuthus]|uniref:U3 small nucleolar RNA-associated protein 14 homolog A-like n=1 Tax=Papilio xuthus TaxID=66420 RepID=A0AAJ6ZVC5_PAPXU|nr:PREDICTED: U3 small nucleolar RNA-associated protein 14 homolog A-like [Papilio xuthus]
MMEEIDVDFVSSEHDRLLNAVTKLDKTQHITEPTRNEPTNTNSEFNLIKRSNKLNLKNVAKVLENKAHHVKISKKLKESQNSSKILPKPIEKPEAERIKRSTGYQQTKHKIGRWDPVVARNRTVNFVSFPLKRVSSKLQPTHEFLSKLKLKSPLERELDEVDPPIPEVPDEEEKPEYPMSYEEMLEHRRQLAKLRAQQSYKAAKAKRQSKIKSKKYHRILKKDKLKQQLKEFEELQSKDPEEALKKLESLEKARALERHTLRHKNTGKWAKSKLIRAKYDKEVRQQLAEQLAVSKSLTHKTVDAASSDDDDDTKQENPDLKLLQDPTNPWMMKRSDKDNVDSEFDFGYKKYLKDKMLKRKELSDSESEDEKAGSSTKSNNAMNILKKSVNTLSENVYETHDKTAINKANEQPKRKKSKLSEKKLSNKEDKVGANAKIVATISNWFVEPVNIDQGNASEDISNIFESFENKLADKVTKKLNKLKKDLDKTKTKPKLQNKKETLKPKKEYGVEYYEFKKQNEKPIIDEPLLETTGKTNDVETETKSLTKILTTETQENPNANIDPSRFIVVKPKYLNTALPKDVNEYDELDDDEQVVPKIDIEEVFEEDDVVDSFRQEKEDEINKDKPQDIDLSLPGWGQWGGKGVKAPKRRKTRFILKAPPCTPRRDENKGDIIIKEYKDPKLAVHKVSDVPFPFKSIKDYEASLRVPLGNTFITEKAHKKLIQPNVLTKAGTIIQPMDEDELLIRKHQQFNNDPIIKLLGQK